MLKYRIFGPALALIGLSSTAWAGALPPPPPPQPTTQFEDRSATIFSIGLRFSFGTNTPSVVGGVRHLETDEDNDVTGILGELDFPLGNIFQLPKIRFMGVLGNRDVQGMAGVGFNFQSASPLIGLGVQGPFSEAGLNWELNGTPDPYVGVNSFRRARSRKVIQRF